MQAGEQKPPQKRGRGLRVTRRTTRPAYLRALRPRNPSLLSTSRKRNNRFHHGRSCAQCSLTSESRFILARLRERVISALSKGPVDLCALRTAHPAKQDGKGGGTRPKCPHLPVAPQRVPSSPASQEKTQRKMPSISNPASSPKELPTIHSRPAVPVC